MGKTQGRPPYASVSMIDDLFKRLENLKTPPLADTKWAKTQFGASLPEAIPSTLVWLGVVDSAFKPDPAIWTSLRFPNTRVPALDRLVRAAYKAVFDQVEVEKADATMLKSAFAQAYGTGDPGRALAAFRALCRHAGIATELAAESATRVRKAPSAKGGATTPSHRAKPNAKTDGGRKVPTSNGKTEIAISLAIEIPASWDEAQIADRIAAVRRAASLGSDGS